MPLVVTCTTCGAKLRVPDRALGKTLKCPKCGTAVAVRAGTSTEGTMRPIPQRTSRTPEPPYGGLSSTVVPEAQPVAQMTACPFCGEAILKHARKCKHCGEILDPALRHREEPREPAAAPPVYVQVNQTVGQQVSVPSNPLSESGSPLLSAFGNVLWILLGGGIFLFLEYLVGGTILCMTIVGIPFGLQCIKLAKLALLPFGKQIVTTESATGCLATVMNLLWLVVAGVWIALTHLFFALVCAILVILLPFAMQHIKLAALALQPFGREIR